MPLLCYHIICTSGIWVYTGMVNNRCKYHRFHFICIYMGDGPCQSSFPEIIPLAVQPMNGNGHPTRWAMGSTGKATAGAQDEKGGHSSHLHPSSCQRIHLE